MNDYKIGLQLFSIQDEMFENPDAALKAVAEMGYECVEFARDLFGHSAEEIKKLCEKYGLEPVSTHQNFADFLENPEPYIKKFKTLGLKFVAIPFVPSYDWVDDRDAVLEKVKKFVNIVNDNGMTPVYHNHDHEFIKDESGKTYMQQLCETFSEDELGLVVDTYWVQAAGGDPADFIDKKIDEIKETLDCVTNQITLLQERKQIIINDVVTGKVKVI